HFSRGPIQVGRHEQDVPASGKMRKEAAVLNHITDAAAKVGNICQGDGRPVETDCAAIWIEQANDKTQKRRFAAATGADENGGFTASKIEIGRMEGNGVAIGFADAGKFDEGLH